MYTSPEAQEYFKDKHIFCFGFGYVANFMAARLAHLGCKISGTTTDPDKKKFLENMGYKMWLFDHYHMIPDVLGALKDVTHILISIPPNEEGDFVYNVFGQDMPMLKNLEWVGYLSAASVYGNHDGAWVSEETPPAPTSRRGSLRMEAEENWYSLHLSDKIPLHIFRLAGIYGPGRSAIDAVKSGTARRLDKPGHVFNRIHVEDIVQVLVASMMHPNPVSIYNVSDDMPTPSQEIIQFACNLLGMDSPPLEQFTQTDMAPIMRSFYSDNKRIRNDKIKNELNVNLLYPDYKKGLQACLEVEAELADILKHT